MSDKAFFFRPQRLPRSVPEWRNVQGMNVFVWITVFQSLPTKYIPEMPTKFVHQRCLSLPLVSSFRRTRGVTTASVLQALWALTVKSVRTSVTAARARMPASATQCWMASCVNAHHSLPDSCVRWVTLERIMDGLDLVAFDFLFYFLIALGLSHWHMGCHKYRKALELVMLNPQCSLEELFDLQSILLLCDFRNQQWYEENTCSSNSMYEMNMEMQQRMLPVDIYGHKECHDVPSNP